MLNELAKSAEAECRSRMLKPIERNVIRLLDRLRMALLEQIINSLTPMIEARTESERENCRLGDL